MAILNGQVKLDFMRLQITLLSSDQVGNQDQKRHDNNQHQNGNTDMPESGQVVHIVPPVKPKHPIKQSGRPNQVDK